MPVWTVGKRCGSYTNRADGGSGRARGGQHNSNEIGGIPGAELLHDVGAMIFDRTRADAEFASGFLVGGAGCEALQHFAFAPRQRFAAWKMQRFYSGRRI